MPTPVTLSILAGRPDVPFLYEMISHLVNAHSFPFLHKLLVIDVLPSAPWKRVSPKYSIADLMAVAIRLREERIIDTVVELACDSQFYKLTAVKHFGKLLHFHRDNRGVPLMGWVCGIEGSESRYVVHFDSDMLLHEAAGFDWVAKGLNVLATREDIMFVAPLPGPPTDDGLLDQGGRSFRREDGVLLFPWFSSRRFLVDRHRFADWLPLFPVRTNRTIRQVFRDRIRKRSPFKSWEAVVDARLRGSGMFRAHLDCPEAWTVHPKEHSTEVIELLPRVAREVAAGRFPPEQAGQYNLHVEAWKRWLRGSYHEGPGKENS